MNEQLKIKFQENLNDNKFKEAYDILITEIEATQISDEIVLLSKQLSEKVRGIAYSHAYKKNDNAAIELENLLKEIIKINGEGIYG